MSITFYPILNYMRLKPYKHFALAAVCIFYSNLLHAYIVKDFGQQRMLFLQVEADMKKGNFSSFAKNKRTLEQYPLFPYLLYNKLTGNLSKTSFAELRNFTAKYADTPLASKLRDKWLYQRAKQQQWNDFLKAYRFNNDIELQCHFIYANLTTKYDTSAIKYIEPIWLSANSQPKSCDKIFMEWERRGYLSRSLVWQRIKLAIEHNNPKLALYLSKYLNNSEKNLIELWIRTDHDPNIIAKSHYFTSNHTIISEILVHGIKKIAKVDPKKSINLWQELSQKHKFNERHWGQVVQTIGISLAKDNHPEADKWLQKIPKEEFTPDVFNSMLKVALNKSDWQAISEIYHLLPKNLSQTEKWQYWYARSLQMLGHTLESQDILHNLTKFRSYYGFLASLRTLKPYSFKNQKANINDEQINAILNIPNMQRAYELHQINRINEGTVEWNKGLSGMNDQERQAAAQLAADWKQPNWSILALANAENKNNLTLRFPKTYSKYIHREAKKNKIDPALIFAITRQESAFVTTACSSAGALGLMQILPRTAREVAYQAKEPLRSYRELLKEDKNIRLGSLYLQKMLTQHQGNSVLATAAYNAGPNRVLKWLPNYDMAADSWIEMIPYNETRNYVQNVLAYTVIYQQLLGNKPSLNSHMPIIKGKHLYQTTQSEQIPKIYKE